MYISGKFVLFNPAVFVLDGNGFNPEHHVLSFPSFHAVVAFGDFSQGIIELFPRPLHTLEALFLVIFDVGDFYHIAQLYAQDVYFVVQPLFPCFSCLFVHSSSSLN